MSADDVGPEGRSRRDFLRLSAPPHRWAPRRRCARKSQGGRERRRPSDDAVPDAAWTEVKIGFVQVIAGEAE